MKNNYEIRGDVTAIFVERKGQKYETLISTERLPLADSFPNTWYVRAFPHGEQMYVQGEDRLGDGKRKRYILHRVVTQCAEGMSVDHINHDTLDNRKENLRVVTHQQNQQNRKGAQRNNKSCGIRGVTWNARSQRWSTNVKVKGKDTWVGSYKELDDARKAVEKARSILMPYSKDGNLDIDRKSVV